MSRIKDIYLDAVHVGEESPADVAALAAFLDAAGHAHAAAALLALVPVKLYKLDGGHEFADRAWSSPDPYAPTAWPLFSVPVAGGEIRADVRRGADVALDVETPVHLSADDIASRL